MKKSNTKTSLKIIMQPEGGASIDLKWNDQDSTHRIEASEKIINELCKLPDYKWLNILVSPHFSYKYCDKCSPIDCEKAQLTNPFPYCFSENNSEVK